jgi:hypothetical protein
MRGITWRGLQRLDDHRFHLIVGNLARRTTAGFVQQPRQPLSARLFRLSAGCSSSTDPIEGLSEPVEEAITLDVLGVQFVCVKTLYLLAEIRASLSKRSCWI